MQTSDIDTYQEQPKQVDTFMTQKMLSRLKSNMNLMLQTGGVKPIYTAEQIFMLANECFEECMQNPIQSNQIITGGAKGGTVIAVSKPRMFTIERLCLYLGVNRNYLADRKNKAADKTDEESIRITSVINYIEQVISAQRFEHAAVREFDGAFIAKLEGLTDKVEHSGEVKNTVTSITFVRQAIEDTDYTEVNQMLAEE